MTRACTDLTVSKVMIIGLCCVEALQSHECIEDWVENYNNFVTNFTQGSVIHCSHFKIQ
uniref:Uncharacterized protein n=1 Tax=Anguilla anguilla TaxID=7936 RepID=A0A0E9WAJ7_ANGAN